MSDEQKQEVAGATRVFWDISGEETSNAGVGGHFYRAAGLGSFIKQVEEKTGKRVIGLAITPGDNNVDVIVETDIIEDLLKEEPDGPVG